MAYDRQISAWVWGVCGVSGPCLECVLGCLGDSGYLMGSSNAKSVDKIPMGIVSISWVLFFPVAYDKQKHAWFVGVCGVSGRCLEGVWGCLGDSGYCLEDDSAKSIDKIQMIVILISWFLFSQWWRRAFFDPSRTNFQVGVGGCLSPPVTIFFAFPSLVMVMWTP